MKRFFALMLAVCMIIGMLAGCNNSSNIDTTTNTESTESVATGTESNVNMDMMTEPTNSESEPSDSETEPDNTDVPPNTTAETEEIPDEPDDIGNGGVEDLPEHQNQTQATEPKPTEHKHDYKSKVINPTCDSKGYTTYTCSCGDSYKSDYKDATGHDYKSTVTEPTCDKDGYTTHKCKNCGKSYTDSKTKATGHSYKTETIAPTTESKGYDLHTCTKCGASYKDNYKDKLSAPTEPPATEPPVTGHTHNYKSVVTAPTCEEHGYTTYTCACGDSYKADTTYPTGHC